MPQPISTPTMPDDLVPDSHGGADGTALTGVDIGHDPDLAAGKLSLIANCLNLLVGGFLQLRRVTDGSII